MRYIDIPKDIFIHNYIYSPVLLHITKYLKHKLHQVEICIVLYCDWLFVVFWLFFPNNIYTLFLSDTVADFAFSCACIL